VSKFLFQSHEILVIVDPGELHIDGGELNFVTGRARGLCSKGRADLDTVRSRWQQPSACRTAATDRARRPNYEASNTSAPVSLATPQLCGLDTTRPPEHSHGMFERGFQRQVFRRTVEGSERTIGPLAASQLRLIIELLNALDDIGLPPN
jgi:hypothetical protein